MPTKLVLGLQHGDEGKGRVVDDLVESWANIVVRFQGGGNAGHTVYDRKGTKYVTHILPVGILNKRILNIIARGCVLNIKDLYKELKEFNVSSHNLKISGFCPLLEPTHILKDRLLYQGKLGTTARGIGPAYADFYARDSILFKDLIEKSEETLIKIQDKFFKFQTNLQLAADLQLSEEYKSIIEEHSKFFHEWINNYSDIVKYVSQFIMNDESLISDLYNKGENILLEGAQGCGLNIHSNNYPDVTSSAPTVGGALNSTGLNHKQIDEVIGVIKAYKTKVGTGNFPSRCNEKDEEVLSKFGNEFGATTGRPRKCGWLDLDEVNHAVKMNGVDHICLIKTDVFCNIENPFVYHKYKVIEIP
jgi:adenylosuccinate synthase